MPIPTSPGSTGYPLRSIVSGSAFCRPIIARRGSSAPTTWRCSSAARAGCRRLATSTSRCLAACTARLSTPSASGRGSRRTRRPSAPSTASGLDSWLTRRREEDAVEMTRDQAQDFLNKEARLLDERRYEEWLELFTEDGHYWIPMDEEADPEPEASILSDDAATRAQRVHQLLRGPHWSQVPSSHTVHSISNIEVDSAGGAEATVRCNLIVCELRPGDHRQF